MSLFNFRANSPGNEMCLFRVHWSVELANVTLRNSVQLEISNQFTLMILYNTLILVLLRKLSLTGDLVTYCCE
jgi:hypothetical protein